MNLPSSAIAALILSPAPIFGSNAHLEAFAQITHGQSVIAEQSPAAETATVGNIPQLPAFRKTPYLIMERSGEGLSVAWQTHQAPKKALFAWGSTPSCEEGEEPMQPITTGADENRFIFTFGHLPPGTRVHYRVTVDGVAHNGSFQNAPKAETEKFSFYALGGTWNQSKSFEGIAQIILSEVNADAAKKQTFCIHTGNFVTAGLDERQWDQQFFNSGSQELFTRMPLVPALGYQEGIGADGAFDAKRQGALLRKYWSPLIANDQFFYTFNFGPIQCFVLDPYTQGIAQGSPQYKALESALVASKHPWKLVVIHEPIWSAQGTTSWQSPAQVNNLLAQKDLSPLFEKYGVQLVLQGRNAYYARASVNKIAYLTLGNAGQPLFTPDPKAPNLEKSASEPHFARFDIDGKRMKITILNPAGKELDSFKIKQ